MMHHLPPDCTPAIVEHIPGSTIPGGGIISGPPDDGNNWIIVPMDDGTVAWCKTVFKNDEAPRE